MEDLFASFEVSKLLKEKGFDKVCFAYYRDNFPNNDKIYDYITPEIYQYIKNSKGVEAIFAPTLQQVIDWFRINYNIYIKAEATDFINDYCKTNFAAMWFNSIWYQKEDFEDYNEALIYAINQACDII